jgi:organic radical activating enzyme
MTKFANIVLPFEHSFIDYPSPDGLCISIYFTGCDFSCTGCQNKELQNVNYFGSEKINIKHLINLINIDSKRWKTDKICLLGGDPLAKCNRNFTRTLLNKIGKDYNFCIYTGYSYDKTLSFDINNFTLLKTGQYKEELKQQSIKTDSHFNLASTNQELYDANFNLLSENGILYF